MYVTASLYVVTLSIIIISGTVALIGWVRLRPLKLLGTLQSDSNQVGSEIEKIFRKENL